jgi:transposase
MIGALTLSPVSRRVGLYFLGQEANAKRDDFIEFVRLLQRQLRRPILVVWDRLSAHFSAVNALAGDARFAFEFLPGYAPELNPVESLWSWCKYGRLANYCPETFLDLGAKVAASLAFVRKEPGHLRAFFKNARLHIS